MNGNAWLLLVAFLAILLVAAWPLGRFMVRLLEAPAGSSRIGRAFYRACGVKPDAEMGWLDYALSLLLFNVLGLFFVYAIQRLQLWLPLNPQQFANVSPDSAFNTAVSFVANTNWQGYAGEATMSHLTQMLALATQNFLSAATGIAVVFALMRGFARHGAKSLGNAWVDLTRITVGVLLPLALLLALVLVSQGVIQNFAPFQGVTPLEATAGTTQTLPMGPRRRRSRCWAPTAAASSTPTRHTRTRTRRPSPTSCRCWRSS
jgi:K+-transporting ATPase ATPase A chain